MSWGFSVNQMCKAARVSDSLYIREQPKIALCFCIVLV